MRKNVLGGKLFELHARQSAQDRIGIVRIGSIKNKISLPYSYGKGTLYANDYNAYTSQKVRIMRTMLEEVA